ncbi:hypothetical protein PRUPE_5G241200 [Prunus persica]|uniref:DHHA1 domain-containing protein n=1 Tax=Prunus persica TaxID=3760 RepID=A0A251PGH5_PRUPE|nr:hypothetical protein PRUPE_5G241200 [Prunus persica]
MSCAAAACRSARTMKAAVLYHYPCPDGAFAALAAHLYFSAMSMEELLFFPNTVYSPITPQHLPLHQIDRLYLLDFVGPPGFVQEISSRVPSVVVLDHHKTALETTRIGENVTGVLDMNRSGATIAFDYFKSKIDGDSGNKNEAVVAQFDRVRRLFEYVEDGDLWRWSLPNSKAFSSGLKDLNFQYDVGLNPSLFQQAVNADSISELRSELGHQLATKSRSLNLRGIGAVVYRVPELENDQMLKISLRSVDTEDTTPISQEFGGGGHQSASSFMLGSAEFEQWKIGFVAL